MSTVHAVNRRSTRRAAARVEARKAALTVSDYAEALIPPTRLYEPRQDRRTVRRTLRTTTRTLTESAI